MNPGEMARGYHNVGVNWKFRVVQRGPTKLGKKRGHPVWGTTNVASPHSGIVATVIASHAKGLGSNRWLNNFFFFVFKHSYAFTFFFFFSNDCFKNIRFDYTLKAVEGGICLGGFPASHIAHMPF